MICCALIAAVLGLALRMLAPWRRLRESPLAWRPIPLPPQRQRFSLAARLKSFGYAFAGIGFLLRNEHNARIHLAAALIAVSTGLWLQISLADWRWIVLAILLVLAAEAMNTAVEQLCDVISHGHHPGIGRAKDVAAGSVLLAAAAALAIGVATFAPYLAGRAAATALPQIRNCGGV